MEQIIDENKIEPQQETENVYEKLYPVRYDGDYFTVMANDIVKGKQEMTLQEARLIRLLITQVVKQDKNFKTYTVRIQDLAEFLEIRPNNLYRDVKTLCENLLKRIVRIGTGNPKQPWKSFQWLQLAEYDGKGTVKLMLSEQLSPFVLELEKWFTQYKLKEILSLNSFYAIRLYELIKLHDGVARMSKWEHNFSVDYLRTFFNCENKYKNTGEFNRRVIELAMKEINEKTDIEVKATYLKTGRGITSTVFYAHINPKRMMSGHKQEQTQSGKEA